MNYAPLVAHPALACAVLLACSNLFMTFAWYGHLKRAAVALARFAYGGRRHGRPKHAAATL